MARGDATFKSRPGGGGSSPSNWVTWSHIYPTLLITLPLCLSLSFSSADSFSFTLILPLFSVVWVLHHFLPIYSTAHSSAISYLLASTWKIPFSVSVYKCQISLLISCSLWKKRCSSIYGICFHYYIFCVSFEIEGKQIHTIRNWCSNLF